MNKILNNNVAQRMLQVAKSKRWEENPEITDKNPWTYIRKKVNYERKTSKK